MEWLTLIDFEREIPDEAAAIAWYIQRRWPHGPRCGDCESPYVTRLTTRPRWWSCRKCRSQTSITSGTPLHGTRKPIRDWVYALWRCSLRTPITARRLKRELGYASYETAWAMLHKIRATLGRPQPPLEGSRIWMGFRLFSVRRWATGDPRRLQPMLTMIASDRDPREIGRGNHVVLPVLDPALTTVAVRERALPRAACAADAVCSEWDPYAKDPTSNRHCSDAVGLVASALSTFLRRFGGVSRRYFRNYLAQFLAAAGVTGPRYLLEPLVRGILATGRPSPDLLAPLLEEL
jgi:hypothetical protein